MQFILIMVGNLSNFTKIDVLRCLLKIDKSLSRSQLSNLLNLGEGTIRSILDILKKNKILMSSKKGHYLSAEGNTIVKKIGNSINMKEIISNNIFPDKKKIALHLKNLNKQIKSLVLRDEAVKNGADGALILKFDKKLSLYDQGYKQDISEIENMFNLSKDDLVIVAYADSYKLAEHGALAVAIELNSDLRNIIGKFK